MPSRKLLRFRTAPEQPAVEDSLLASIPSASVTLPFSQNAFISTLLRIAVTLVILHLITIVDRFILPNLRIFPNNLFDLNGESNFPAYFSSALLLVASGLLAVIAWVNQQTSKRFVWHWQGLALIFLGLSIDEALSLHEKASEPLKILLNADGIFYYTWIVPAIGFIAVLLLTYRKFLLALPAKTRRGISLAGGLYISGTIGSEMISGFWASMNDIHNLAYGLLVAIEESLEMVGLIVFISVLLSLLRSIAGDITFQFVKR